MHTGPSNDVCLYVRVVGHVPQEHSTWCTNASVNWPGVAQQIAIQG